MNANGLNPKIRDAGGRPGADIWWAYTVCTQDRTYVALSRTAPAKSGLAAGRKFSFSVRSNRIYFRNGDGQEEFLRIIRQDKGKSCPR